MYRQGDVLLRRVATIPSDAKRVPTAGRVVVAEGEVTGHAHAFDTKGVALLEASDGRRFLEVGAEAPLKHEEHSTIPTEPGLYEVVIQREYDDASEWRQVAD